MIFNSLGNCHQFLVSLNSFRFAWFGLRSYFAVFYVCAFILDGGEGLLENQPCRPSESKQMPQKLVNPHFGMPKGILLYDSLEWTRTRTFNTLSSPKYSGPHRVSVRKNENEYWTLICEAVRGISRGAIQALPPSDPISVLRRWWGSEMSVTSGWAETASATWADLVIKLFLFLLLAF